MPNIFAYAETATLLDDIIGIVDSTVTDASSSDPQFSFSSK